MVMDYLTRLFSAGSPIARENMVSYFPVPPGATYTPQYLYDLLEAYYFNNGLYEDLQRGLDPAQVAHEAVYALRNPAFRATEFYASKLWPGKLPEALPIQTKNDRIVDPIQQVWRWSNWTNKKQLAARWIALYGDLFIKVAQRPTNEATGQSGRVYFEMIKPRTVTDLDLDERGYVVYLRIDVDKHRRVGDEVEKYTHTEIWSKDLGTYRRWEHDRGTNFNIEELKAPDETVELRAMGIDFIPFVYAPFRDVGEERGCGCFALQLDKIDEVNRQATRLHQNLFRYGKPIWAVFANMVDATRRPLPAPRIEGDDLTAVVPGGTSDTTAYLDGEPVLYMPGLAKLEGLIPNINWQAHLDAVDKQIRELEDDLPELIYYRVIRDFREPSGRALSYMLSPAIDRVLEVRGNAEAALIRAHQMALTIGMAAGLFPEDTGDYWSINPEDNFEHTFTPREVIPLTDLDKAEAERAEAEAKERKHNLRIPYRRLWLELGYTEEEIADNEAWMEEEEKAAQERLLEQQEEQAKLAQEFAPKPAPAQNGAARPAITTRSGQPANRPSGTQSRNDPRVSR